MKEKTKNVSWYNNPNILTNIILVTAIIIIAVSQAMAVKSNVSGILMLRNLLNHNLTYMAAIVYFIFLKTKVGRRNFSIMNVCYIMLYVVNTVASVFTIVQSFSLSSIFAFVLNVLVLCYICVTFLPETRLWKDYSLGKLPLQEVNNDGYFYSVTLMAFGLMLVNLIHVINYNGIVLTIFDTIYIILFTRYVYLYKKYIEKTNKGDNKDE